MKRLMMIFALIIGFFVLAACETGDGTYNGRDTTYDGTEETYNGEDSTNGNDEDSYNDNDDIRDDDTSDDTDNGDGDDTSDDTDNGDGDDTSNDDTDNGDEDEEDTLRVFTSEELAEYDGLDGSDAYIAVDNTVYDVTNSSHWMDGIHQGRYQAGQGLTDEIDNLSPHRRRVLNNIPIVGTLED